MYQNVIICHHICKLSEIQTQLCHPYYKYTNTFIMASTIQLATFTPVIEHLACESQKTRPLNFHSTFYPHPNTSSTVVAIHVPQWLCDEH